MVPLKRIGEAKQRLAAALSPQERATLVSDMLGHVLGLLGQVEGLTGVAVVGSDPGLLPETVLAIADPGTGLNAAIALAARHVEALGATTMLVVAADLPLLARPDIEAMLAAGRSCQVVIAPDRAGLGTNALLLSPPTLFPPEFGEASLERHVAAAGRQGVAALRCDLPGIGFDIDLPEDLADLGLRLQGGE